MQSSKRMRLHSSAAANLNQSIMLDGMSSQNEGDEGVPAAEFSDRIGALPDELLHQVLSLLPAEEAVRTSVLARRWRYLWKSAPGVRLGCLDQMMPPSMNALRRFVDPFLHLRRDSPLQTFELTVGDFPTPEDELCVNLWFRHAVTRQVQVLKLHICVTNYVDPYFPLQDVPLVSQHLKKLQLYLVRCFSGFLDFSSCPALDSLEFERCDLSFTTEIMSESLKSLTIAEDSILCEDVRMQICTPNLIALCLDAFSGKTPVFESMPSLVDASVRIDSSNSIAYGGPVLLKGLVEATNLTLIGIIDTFIFKWDLRWCPTFSKLKTLVLNENWCVPDDLHALACILQHAPNLEKLSLQLSSMDADPWPLEDPKHKVEIIGSFSSIDRSTAISEQLKIVEIKCDVLDGRVHKVLQFLCTFGILFRF